jgi:hypothetical protein
MSLVRRFWLQIAGVAVALALVGMLAVLVARGSGRTDTPGDAGGPATARTTTLPGTPDARVAQVKSAVRAFLTADQESARTGDAGPVDDLCVPGSQAQGNAGIAATHSRIAHENFISSRIDFIESSWQVDALSASAVVDVDYQLYGHTATWPDLRPLESDHQTPLFHMHGELVLDHGKWLFNRLG